MKVEAWVFDLGNTLMAIPEEYDEELRLSDLLGFPDPESVRSVIYRLCDQYPGQSTEEFLARFDVAVNLGGSSVLRSAMRDVWDKSVEMAELKPGAWNVLDSLRAAGMKLALRLPPKSFAAQW